MILVTGGAGFIGSNLVAALAERGKRVVVCDRLGTGDKWRNLAKHALYDFVAPEGLEAALERHREALSAVVHLGAISATTERDVDLLIETNFRLSCRLWDWCAANRKRLIYASSAATYGDGAAGFEDDPAALGRLRPLNPYGWSKHLFDGHVLRSVEGEGPVPPQWVGLKFFNVYGPNEYHKGDMRSAVARNFPALAAGEPMRLFRSYRPDYADGAQRRDFIYVRDCVEVMIWLLDSWASTACSTSAAARRGAGSSWRTPCSRRWASRHGSPSSTCPSRSGRTTSTSPRRRWPGCVPPVIGSPSRRSRKASPTMCAAISRSPTPIAESWPRSAAR